MTPAATPESLILSRAAAFSRGDFGFIYDSYHPDAAFLRFFPIRGEYVDYACHELSGSYRISDCRVLRSEVLEDEAYSLFCQTIEHDGTRGEVLEIGHSLRGKDGCWRYHGGMKLDPAQLTADPLTAPWNELETAGNGMWI